MSNRQAAPIIPPTAPAVLPGFAPVNVSESGRTPSDRHRLVDGVAGLVQLPYGADRPPPR